jgi:signal transduction histidine kinase
VTAEDDEADGVVIRVLDDGPGFSAEEADDLFGLYFRSNAAKAAPGSGIGLFVCRQLVEAMGGRISARPRPSGGAEFAFSLPRHPDGQPGRRRGTSGSEEGGTGSGADGTRVPRVSLAAAR